MFKKILAALVSVVALVVSGCGGGGGGGAASPEPVSMSVSQQAIALAASYIDTAPYASFSVSVDHFPSGGLYVQGNYTTHGIASVNLYPNANSEYVYINFRAPLNLGAGVYTDTISIQICRDQQCTQQVTNSPQQITVTYTVTPGIPGTTAATISTLSPATAVAGGADFLMTIDGSGFYGLTQVQWNGVTKSTNYVSSTQLTVPISASDIAAAGSYPVTVSVLGNPYELSNTLQFTVVNANLTLNKISPVSVPAGSAAFMETVVGTGFDASSTVQWNGTARPTTYVSTTELLAQIGSADVAGVATANVTVTRTGTSTTSAKTVSIVAPSIDATAFQINPQHSGAINFANIVSPSAFPLTSKWTTALNGPPSYALIAGGRVFATAALPSGGAELYAFSATTGARLWGPVAFPYKANATYENGQVFVMSQNVGTAGTLYAYDAVSGSLLWSRSMASPAFVGPPTASGGIVYASTSDYSGVIYAFNETDGSLLWTGSMLNGGEGTPAVTLDGVYASYPCLTYDFRPLTGELIWNNSTGCSGGGGATATVANGVVYSPNTSAGYNGMALNAKTGAFISSYAATSAPPVIGSQMGYFLNGGTLNAMLLSSGVTQWSFSGDGGFYTAPVLVNNYVFILSTTGNLYGLDATTGSQLWQTNLGGTITLNASWFNNMIMQLSGLSAGGGLLVIPVGNTLVAYTLSSNP